MEVEMINGVKTVFRSGKEKTLQNIANLFFRFYCEIRRQGKVVENDTGKEPDRAAV